MRQGDELLSPDGRAAARPAGGRAGFPAGGGAGADAGTRRALGPLPAHRGHAQREPRLGGTDRALPHRHRPPQRGGYAGGAGLSRRARREGTGALHHRAGELGDPAEGGAARGGAPGVALRSHDAGPRSRRGTRGDRGRLCPSGAVQCVHPSAPDRGRRENESGREKTNAADRLDHPGRLGAPRGGAGQRGDPRGNAEAFRPGGGLSAHHARRGRGGRGAARGADGQQRGGASEPRRGARRLPGPHEDQPRHPHRSDLRKSRPRRRLRRGAAHGGDAPFLRPPLRRRRPQPPGAPLRPPRPGQAAGVREGRRPRLPRRPRHAPQERRRLRGFPRKSAGRQGRGTHRHGHGALLRHGPRHPLGAGRDGLRRAASGGRDAPRLGFGGSAGSLRGGADRRVRRPPASSRGRTARPRQPWPTATR